MTQTVDVVLGTAQLTSSYGIANRRGRVSRHEARALLAAAEKMGVGALDTAPVYDDAETLIGEAGTKLPVFTKAAGLDVEGSVRASLLRLRRTAVDVLFLHDPNVIQGDPGGVIDRAASLVGGMVGALGASVYTPEQFEGAVADPRISCIQAPVNAADRRLVDGGLLDEAARRGVRVYARSVFLQGALLLEPDEVPEHLAELAPVVHTVRGIAAGAGCRVEDLLIRAVVGLPGITGLVIGCETVDQLRNDVESARQGSLDPRLAGDLTQLPPVPESVVDPRRWPGSTVAVRRAAR